MSYSLASVLVASGLQEVTQLPSVTTCPFCKEFQLEVHSRDLIFCRHCHFIGDGIELYSKVKKLDTIVGLKELRNEDIIDVEDDFVMFYESSYADKAIGARIHAEAMVMYAEQPSSLRAMLQGLGTALEEGLARKLLPHVGLIRVASILEVIEEPSKALQAALKAIGRYTGLGLACWNNSTLVGYWVVTPRGVTYLPISNTSGVGGSLSVRIGDDYAFALDNPVELLKIWLKSIKTQSYVPGMTCWAGIQIMASPAKQVIYWSPDNIDTWYYAATKHYGAKSVLSSTIDVDKPSVYKQSFINKVTRQLVTNANQPLHTLGLLLLEKPTAEARAVLSNCPLDERARAELLSYFSGADTDALQALFSGAGASKHIEFNGKSIAETEQGWVCNKTLICDAILRIDNIRVGSVSADAVASGSVTYKKRNLVFSEKLETIRKKGADWLHGFILTKTGCSCCIAPGWQRHIFNIAQAFHTPEGLMDSGNYAWEGDTLRLPYFSVTPQGLVITTNRVTGPSIQMPSHVDAITAEACTDMGVGRVLFTVLHNLIATKQGKPCRPLGISEQPHRIADIAAILGLNHITEPEIPTLLSSDATPLPSVMAPVAPDLGKVDKNIIVSLDTKSYRFLTAFPNWVRVGKISADIGVLRLVFAIVPGVLEAGLESDDPMFHRKCIPIARKALLPYGVLRERFTLVASMLDSERAPTGLGGTTVNLIQQAVTYNAISMSHDVAGYSVKPSEVAAYLVGTAFKLPPIGDIEKALLASNLVFKTGRDEWMFPEHIWSLFTSYNTPTQFQHM